MIIDTSTEFGARVRRRLDEEQIGWLTTVRPDGMPQPVPVWFHWDGETFLILSHPNARKVRNLAGNPNASLHLNSDDQGGNVVILTGQARADMGWPSDERLAAYFAKYAQGIRLLNTTPESLADEYSTAIHLRPTRVSGH
jgi:PPOX class probable F420-dependent enzyme